MTLPIALLITVGGGYILGSIPTSVIVGILFFHKDPRKHGSGNAGGTNSFRVFGWKAGIFVSAFDIAKAYAAAAFGAFLGSTLEASLSTASGAPVFPSWASASEAFRLLGGAAAVAGHVWTVFAGFRGGKGVACAAGLLLNAAPLPLLAALGVFILILGIFGIVSLASMSAAVAFPIALTLFRITGYGVSGPLLISAWILGPLIIWTHRSNLRRLARGEEKSFEKLRFLGRIFNPRSPEGI